MLHSATIVPFNFDMDTVSSKSVMFTYPLSDCTTLSDKMSGAEVARSCSGPFTKARPTGIFPKGLKYFPLA